MKSATARARRMECHPGASDSRKRRDRYLGRADRRSIARDSLLALAIIHREVAAAIEDLLFGRQQGWKVRAGDHWRLATS